MLLHNLGISCHRSNPPSILKNHTQVLKILFEPASSLGTPLQVSPSVSHALPHSHLCLHVLAPTMPLHMDVILPLLHQFMFSTAFKNHTTQSFLFPLSFWFALYIPVLAGITLLFCLFSPQSDCNLFRGRPCCLGCYPLYFRGYQTQHLPSKCVRKFISLTTFILAEGVNHPP